MPVVARIPLRGEVWLVQLPVDPPGKGLRPVVIVSIDARNRHEYADSVLAVPLTTSIHKAAPTHVLLTAAETGLQSDSAARAEDVTTILKRSLVEPKNRLRQLSNRRVCEIARKIAVAMGCD